jgi:hypothetical protein
MTRTTAGKCNSRTSYEQSTGSVPTNRAIPLLGQIETPRPRDCTLRLPQSVENLALRFSTSARSSSALSSSPLTVAGFQSIRVESRREDGAHLAMSRSGSAGLAHR